MPVLSKSTKGMDNTVIRLNKQKCLNKNLSNKTVKQNKDQIFISKKKFDL